MTSSVWHSSLIQVFSLLVTYAYLSSWSLTAVFSDGRSRSVPRGKQHALLFLFPSVSFLSHSSDRTISPRSMASMDPDKIHSSKMGSNRGAQGEINHCHNRGLIDLSRRCGKSSLIPAYVYRSHRNICRERRGADRQNMPLHVSFVCVLASTTPPVRLSMPCSLSSQSGYDC